MKNEFLLQQQKAADKTHDQDQRLIESLEAEIRALNDKVKRLEAALIE